MTFKRLFACGALCGVLSGCAHAPTVVSAPPATTPDSCRQIHDFFKGYDMTAETSTDPGAGCHMHVGASDRLSQQLDRRLQAAGWTRDPVYDKGVVPSIAFYDTPSTHCSVEKLVNPNAGSGNVSGGIGVGGGSHLSTGFGIGIGLGGPSSTLIDYKIDCLPKK